MLSSTRLKSQAGLVINKDLISLVFQYANTMLALQKILFICKQQDNYHSDRRFDQQFTIVDRRIGAIIIQSLLC